MPQPLSTFRAEIVWNPVQWGPEHLAAHPEFAAQVLQTIAVWSEIDKTMTEIIAGFMLADFELVSEMLREIRPEMLNKVADATARLRLTPEHYTLFAAALRTTKASRNRRNDFAHHIWGAHPDLPDALILADPRDLSGNIMGFLGPAARGGGSGTVPLYAHGTPWDSSKHFVWRAPDFKAALADAQRALRIAGLLRQVGHIHPTFYDQARHRQACEALQADPLVAQALARGTTPVEPAPAAPRLCLIGGVRSTTLSSRWTAGRRPYGTPPRIV